MAQGEMAIGATNAEALGAHEPEPLDARPHGVVDSASLANCISYDISRSNWM